MPEMPLISLPSGNFVFVSMAYGQFIQPNISTEKTRALKLGKLYNLN